MICICTMSLLQLSRNAVPVFPIKTSSTYVWSIRTLPIFIPKTCRWLRLDFTPLREPRYFYESQECIDPHRVEMASAAMVHFGLDPGKFVRWLSGEYTGHHRDVCCTLNAIHEHVSAQDYEHIKSILLDGCPAQFTFDDHRATS